MGTQRGTAPAPRTCLRWDGLRVATLVQYSRLRHGPQISPQRTHLLLGGKWQHQGGCCVLGY